jgi:hypothetical protein
LLDLDIGAVEPITAAAASKCAKGVELLALGGLLVQYVLHQEVPTLIIHGVRS